MALPVACYVYSSGGVGCYEHTWALVCVYVHDTYVCIHSHVCNYANCCSLRQTGFHLLQLGVDCNTFNQHLQKGADVQLRDMQHIVCYMSAKPGAVTLCLVSISKKISVVTRIIAETQQ